MSLDDVDAERKFRRAHPNTVPSRKTGPGTELKGILSKSFSMSRTGFEIFAPLVSHPNAMSLISTWHIGAFQMMQPVVSRMRPENVRLLVGFSKQSHNLPHLLHELHLYRKAGFRVRIAPDYHFKGWTIGADTYIGSANFCRETVVNHMLRLHVRSKESLEVWSVLDHYWQQASDLSNSTILERVAPIKEYFHG
jgi:hypothetical protein